MILVVLYCWQRVLSIMAVIRWDEHPEESIRCMACRLGLKRRQLLGDEREPLGGLGSGGPRLRVLLHASLRDMQAARSMIDAATVRAARTGGSAGLGSGACGVRTGMRPAGTQTSPCCVTEQQAAKAGTVLVVPVRTRISLRSGGGHTASLTGTPTR